VSTKMGKYHIEKSESRFRWYIYWKSFSTCEFDFETVCN